MSIKETEFGYEINETVQGGHLVRTTYASYDIKSKWTKELEFIDLDIDNKYHWENIISDSNGFHYHRAVRAKTRHLRELKIYLGIEKLKEEQESKKIIWYSPYYKFDNNIYINNFIETNKTFKGAMNYNKSSMRYVEANDDNIKIAEEYQQKYKEFEEYKKEVLNKLFEK